MKNSPSEIQDETRLHKGRHIILFVIFVLLTIILAISFPSVSKEVNEQFYIAVAQIISVFYVAVPITRALRGQDKESPIIRRYSNIEFLSVTSYTIITELSCLYAIAFGGNPLSFWITIYGFILIFGSIVIFAKSYRDRS